MNSKDDLNPLSPEELRELNKDLRERGKQLRMNEFKEEVDGEE